MKSIPIPLDFVITLDDLDALQTSKQGFIYGKDSFLLRQKSIRHADYHHPNLVLSYGKDNHFILNLETGARQQFYLDNEGLDIPQASAVGVTDHLAMIALGDLQRCKIQVVNTTQTLDVRFQTILEQELTPPLLFTGSAESAILVFKDGKMLEINLDEFALRGFRSGRYDISRGKYIYPQFSDIGPFLILNLTQDMEPHQVYRFRELIQHGINSDWIAVDRSTVINKDRVSSATFDDVIDTRKRQYLKLSAMLDDLEDRFEGEK